MSVMTEIERLEGAKNALATSIEGKGVTVPEGTKIDGMAALVDQISTRGSGADFYIDDASYLFYNGARFSAKDGLLSAMKDVTEMTRMFEGCNQLVYFDFSQLDVSKVKDMSYMFRGCSNLEDINFSGVNAISLETMSNIFRGSGVKEVNLSGFIAPNLKDMSGAFASCNSMTKVDFGDFSTVPVTNMGNLFDYNKAVGEILNFSSVGVINGSNMFPDGNQMGNIQCKLHRLTFKTGLPDGQYAIRSKISVMYCSFDRAGMVEMFNTLPYVTGVSFNKTIQIKGNPCVADGSLTDEDIAIATEKGWNVSK